MVAAHFRDLSATTATCRQAVANFEAERLLPCRFWLAFIHCLEPAADRPGSLIERIRDHMRRWSLSGPGATIGKAEIFGRAVTREALAEVFVEQKKFGTLESALRHISYAESLDLQELQRQWDDFDLGRYVMWATFEPQGGAPFGPWAASANQIRSILGLDRSMKDRPLLLLEYKVVTTQPRVPTIVEAYSGINWLPHFRAAGTSEIAAGHGWTQVWEEDANQFSGRPEVVHKPIKASELSRKLRVVE